MNIKIIIIIWILLLLTTIVIWSFAIKEYGIASGQIEAVLIISGFTIKERRLE